MLPIPFAEAEKICDAAATKVWQQSRRHHAIADLRQQAWGCLLQLAEKWDAAKAPFAPYAGQWLPFKLRDFLWAQSFISKSCERKAKLGLHKRRYLQSFDNLSTAGRYRAEVATARCDTPPGWELQEEAAALIDSLPADTCSREVLRRLYLQHKRPAQVAAELGICIDYVSMVKTRGLRALKRMVA